MSQPTTKVSRPRRASRAPSRMGDENSLAPPAAGPKLLSKSSMNSISTNASAAGTVGSSRVSTKSLSVSSAAGLGKSIVTSTSVGVAAGPRRALVDVSNAVRVQAPAERQGKETLLIQKPVRARTTSNNTNLAPQQHAPQPPSSTGTGLSRLKINQQSTSSSLQTAVPHRSSRPGATIKDAGGKAFAGAAYNNDMEDDIEVLNDDARVGLGIHASEEMADVVSATQGNNALKRSHEFPSAVEDFDDDEEDDSEDGVGSKVRIIEGEMDMDDDDWMRCSVEEDQESERILEALRNEFDEQLDIGDTTMVAEYSEEIFEYMADLEVQAMPNPRYMDSQSEIEWGMRTTLIDWLLQVHMRYHMLPETLWIAINIVDRFLSNRVVSLIKFQLVGVTAMFVAAKYEEIMAPSVEEFVYMTEGGYTRDEILKGERIILQSLEFNISPYCSPYSWVRRISKADDYDIQTRTLSKFLMEVTLLDHRFLRAKPSMIAAIGMYLARKMLGGEWNEAFIYYSNYTEAQLLVPTSFLIEAIAADEFDAKFVYKKYAAKKFLKASMFARTWAKAYIPEESFTP